MAGEEVIFKVKMSTADAEKGLEKVKKSIKETNTELKSTVDNFGAFGVTIGSVKQKFGELRKIGGTVLTLVGQQAQKAALSMRLMFGGKMAAGAKNLFNVIKLGVASTGIGLLVVALGSLVTFFTKTKKGAELLQVSFKAIGATISVLTDRISKIGGAIVKVFSGDFKGAAEDAKAAVSGLGDEIVKETKQMIELTKASQSLRDSQRELNVETARRRSELEELKLIAEDTTKTEGERLEAAKAAMQLETDLLDKRVANAAEALRIKKEEVEASESTAEDLDELAQLEIDLFNIKQESTTKQIELNNKINSIAKEGEAKRLEAIQKENEKLAEKAANELEITKKKNELLDELELQRAENEEERELIALEQQQEKAQAEIEALTATEEQKQELLLQLEESFNIKKADIDAKYRAKDKADREKIEADKDKKRADDLAKEKALADSKAALATGTLSLIQDVFGKESKAGKAAAIAQATINTYQGITAALASAPPPINTGLAAITAAAGFKSVADIVSTQEPKFARGGMVGGFGTGTSDSVSAKLSKGETVINARSTRMFKPLLSAINEAGGGVGFANGGTLDTSSGGQTFGAIKAFVVTDDITNSQDSLDKIRQKATI
jgi:hypothetical protein